MIDWLTLEIPLVHDPIESGRVISVTPEGEIEWQSEKRTAIRGSYESNLRIRSAGTSTENLRDAVSVHKGKSNTEAITMTSGIGRSAFLHVDGNPAKFLNGHNVVGIRDITILVDMCISKIFAELNWLYTKPLKETILNGDFKVTRIDINDYIEFNSESDALAWQMAAESVATSRQGKFVRKGTTIYMGKHSRRVSLKIYSKYLELTQAKKGHSLPIALPHKQQLLDYAEKKLRIEATFRSLFLKDLGLNQAKDLTPQKLGELYAQQVGKLEMNAQVKLQPYEEMDLPRAVMGTYMLWKDGARLKDILPHNTFYRHRKILKEHDIDIKVSPKKFQSNVIPLIRKIEAKPVKMPQWSESVGLIFN